MHQNPVQPLIDQLSALPGIGQKSAERLAYFFLSLPQADVGRFTETLTHIRRHIRYCERCFNLSLSQYCSICEDTSREANVLCVVAQPKDIGAIERMRQFQGRYHVLGGLISPLDGIHPELLRINELQRRLSEEPVKEIILAINPTVEGDATILYLSSVLRQYSVTLSQLAYGLPMGANIDYTDEITLRLAFDGRNPIQGAPQ